MANKRSVRNIAKGLCAAMCACAVVTPLTACGPDEETPNGSNLNNETSPLVLATDILDGVFNPFFYTSGSDGDIVSQTQIGMLSGNKDDGTPLANWDEPCVAHDFSVVTTGTRDDMVGGSNDYSHYYTDYYFAIKDNIKFSDGVPLTMEDVLFNIYMYLDPAYTGSSTMYSVDIQGLNAYRSQTENENDSNASEDFFNNETERRMSYIYEWLDNDQTGDWGEWDLYEAYPDDFSGVDGEVHTIESDILKAHELFREELGRDWTSSTGVDIEKEYEKYKDRNGNRLITDAWQVFLLSHNVIQLNYIPASGNQDAYYEYIDNYNRTDHSEATLINYVYNSKVGNYERATEGYKTSLAQIITYYSTATTLREYVRASVISHETKRPDGSMAVPTVRGITYEKADYIPTDTNGGRRQLKDANGNVQEYDVLHIRINGVDPKAIQNFSFTVAPGHYYSPTWDRVKIYPDTANGETYYFGVEHADPDFMNNIKGIQVPCGAGPYRAANESGGTVGKDNTAKGQFFDGSIVYMARNDNFMLGSPKIRLLRYKVISNNLLYNSVGGEVHFASPSMDTDSVQKLEGADKNKLNYSYADNLGYGYIGINARYVPNIYVRRAIMTTLNPQMCVQYFGGDLYASVIKRPMSKTLTDYYNNNQYGSGVDSLDDYYPYDSTGDAALQWLRDPASGCRESGGRWVDDKGQPLKYTFTIAGDTDDHPAARMLRNAADILNEIGFDITVSNDSQALIKLSSGLLTVWAAAWSSSSDPDMYQVYHKNSNATSTTAWGYPYLKSNQSSPDEQRILNELSDLIDEGREWLDVSDRKPIYLDALNKLMELAVEFPTYQRKVYYVWPKGVFDESTIYTQNNKTYQSPLSDIWKVSFNQG